MVMNFAARKSTALATGLLAVFGILLGVAAAPTLYWYGSTDPQILWQSGGATALFIAVFGAIGYTTQAGPVGYPPVCVLCIRSRF